MNKLRRYNRTKEELKEILEEVNRNFPRHHRKVEEITVETVLKPEEAIEIAKNYLQEKKMVGTVDEQIKNIYFDEGYTFKVDPKSKDNDDIRPAWRVTVDLPPSTFTFEDYTLIVSDRDKKVLGILDANGHPANLR